LQRRRKKKQRLRNLSKVILLVERQTVARRKATEAKIKVGNIREVNGVVNIAADDIYRGDTTDQVSVLITQII
jgi:hypothetical protein